MVLLVLVLGLTQAAAADAGVRPAAVPGPFGNEQLSDEATITRWAHDLFPGVIYRSPDFAARGLGRLRVFTEDGEFEIYLILGSHIDGDGRTWFHIRIPGRPNGRTGWTPADNLGDVKLVRTKLRIDRRALRATLFRNGIAIWRSRVGIGKAATPTPTGRYYVRERLRNLGGSGVYGPWAFGTSAYSVLSDWPRGGVVGIHGTNAPRLIPGRPSHGCVRVPNARITQLARLMPLGTPIEIV